MRLQGGISTASPVISGVPQGTVLGLLLFLIPMSDIDIGVLNAKVVSFAEDTRLYSKISYVEDCDSIVYMTGQKLTSWFLTPQKSIYLFLQMYLLLVIMLIVCDWGRIRYEVMKRVLIVKADSSKQYRDKLIHSENRLLVESSPNDLYWGSGLNYHLTQTTHPDYYPGLNKLGKLLCEVRVLLREKISSSSLPAEAMDEVTTPQLATLTSGNIDTKTDNMNDNVTSHIPPLMM